MDSVTTTKNDLSQTFTDPGVSLDNSIRIELPNGIQPNPIKKRRTRKNNNNEQEPQVPTIPVELLEHQISHYEKLLDIFTKSKIALDLSPMGTGKTYTATKIAEHFNVQHVLVIAPVSVLPKWENMKKVHGLKLKAAISYCSLRSVKYKQPSHGLLTRIDTQQESRTSTGEVRIIEKTEFVVTSELKKLISEGLLLIVDEIQNVKNVSSQFLSVKELIREITETESNSKVLLLSGTPIDKELQVINLYRAMNILQGNIAHYDPYRHKLDPRGFMKLYRTHISYLPENMQTNIELFHTYFRDPLNLTPTRTRDLWNLMKSSPEYSEYLRLPLWIREIHTTLSSVYSRVHVHDENSSNERATILFMNHIYQMFIQIFCNKLSSKMKIQQTEVRLHQKNAKYPVYSLENTEISSDNEELLFKAVQLLKHVTNFNPDTQTITFDREHAANTFQGITRALQMIETAKLGILKHVTAFTLISNPECKVVIFLNYSASIRDLERELQQFNPFIFDGSTNVKRRQEIIQKFQSDSLEHRLIIGNLQCLSTGIDLDDKFGNRPRYAFVSPNYCTITLRQLSFRFLRADTKSDTNIHYIFGRKTVEIQENNQENNEQQQNTKTVNIPGYEELPILHALARKSNVIRQVENANSGDIRYPGDFVGGNELI